MKYKNLIVATRSFVDCCKGGLIEQEGLYRKTVLGNYRDLYSGTTLNPRRFVEHPQHVRLLFWGGGEGEYNLTDFRPFTEEFDLPQDAQGSKEEAKKMFLAKHPETQFKTTSAA